MASRGDKFRRGTTFSEMQHDIIQQNAGQCIPDALLCALLEQLSLDLLSRVVKSSLYYCVVLSNKL